MSEDEWRQESDRVRRESARQVSLFALLLHHSSAALACRRRFPPNAKPRQLDWIIAGRWRSEARRIWRYPIKRPINEDIKPP